MLDTIREINDALRAIILPILLEYGPSKPAAQDGWRGVLLGAAWEEVARTKGTALFGGRVGLPSPVGQRLAIQAA